MSDRSVRNLDSLERSASTSRVLNLLAIARRHAKDKSWRENPFFQSEMLNRSILVKHRLRRNEADFFRGPRQVATKIIMPIDHVDLSLGGRFAFVGQSDYDTVLRQVFRISPDHPDVRTLAVLDRLPSLDPFLLREQLRREGIEPASCYFSINDADVAKMHDFVREEIEPLVRLSLGNDAAAAGSTERLVKEIISNSRGKRLLGLGAVLRLSPEEYEEGLFCWKGFLYFKWSLSNIAGELALVIAGLETVKPVGPVDGEAREYLKRGRAVLLQLLKGCWAQTRQTLGVYEEAYSGLTDRGDPLIFRDFLLRAPSLFDSLGEQLGAIQHIISFWKHRFGPRSTPPSAPELIDIFMDFESSLQVRPGAGQ